MWGRREDIKGCCPVTQLPHEYHYSNHIAMNIIIGSATHVVFVTCGFIAHPVLGYFGVVCMFVCVCVGG